MYGGNPATDPHRHNKEVHYRLYHHPTKGPVVICVQWLDYRDYDAGRIMTPDAYQTEEEAEAALRGISVMSETMSDRERVAQAIDPRNWDSFYDGFREDSWEHKQRRVSLEQADRVLAALGDRLMPELPEWVRQAYLYHRNDGDWRISINNTTNAAHYQDQYSVSGTGPTPASAIRAALEQP